MQHHRGLEIAAVDAEIVFRIGEQALRHAEPTPRTLRDKHLAADAEFARHDTHDLDIAAVAVDDHQLPDAGPRDAFADLGPGADQRFRRKCDRAGRTEVLVRFADSLNRQEQHGKIGRQALRDLLDHAGGDNGIRAHRKVRAMLLGRGDGQDGDRPVLVESCEIAGGQVKPVGLAHR